VKTFQQIFAIARTEFRFGLRRGAPVVVTAVIGLILYAGILMNMGNNVQMADPHMEQYTQEQVDKLAQNGITAEVYRSLSQGEFADLTAIETTQTWFYLYLVLLFLPVATGGMIPADRQYGVFELLRSTPLDGSTYLAGKVLGGIGIVVFIACFPFLLFLAVLEGIMLKFIGFGVPLDLITFYLKLSVLDGLPVLACGAALGVLAGVAFRTRRSAILPGILTGILAIFSWLSAFRFPASSPNGFDVAAYSVFQKYQSIWQALWDRISKPGAFSSSYEFSLVGIGEPAAGIGRVLVMYLVILAMLAGLFSLARLWLKWKENF
jgi:ABC-type transport system involved in multi-copper enzyme maturation permease subunit